MQMEHIKYTLLYPGIGISFLTLTEKDDLSFAHEPLDHIMEINYCIDGRMGWKMGNGNHIFLGAKSFSLHTMKACANSEIHLPNGFYKGITIYVDLHKLTDNPPVLLADTGINGTGLYEKFCPDGTCASFAGNEQTESIFKFLYNQPEQLQSAYQKIKVLELLLYLYRAESTFIQHLNEYRSEQVEIIRTIHEQLMEHLEQRFTIEDLSKQYLMNPTTLKAAFKSVYGNSIAAHIKQHRMETAAKRLLESERSVAQIAMEVGYDSQSKFSAAFKDYFHVLPKDYRKGFQRKIIS